MSLEEFEENPDRKTKRYLMMRSITDFGMGVIYIGVGMALLFAKQFNFSNVFTLSIAAKLIAALAIIYGLFRIYRGYKKQYYKES